MSPALQQQLANTEGMSEFELPKTTLAKLAKGSVSRKRSAHSRIAADGIAILRSRSRCLGTGRTCTDYVCHF